MIIFTDLDGTLLDHQTYRFEPALPALEAVKARNIPLILASSKTAAEIMPLQAEIGIEFPAIVENGAGIYWPHKKSPPVSDYKTIRETLEKLPSTLRKHFQGFGDMGIDGIITATSLAPEAAQNAANRLYSEPGLFSGNDREKQAFLNALAHHDIKATQGGRFLTLSFGATKADQMAEVIRYMVSQKRNAQPSLALGDAPNDIAMLEAADFGVIIRNKAHQTLPLIAGEAEGKVTRATQEGPKGWNEAVLSFIANQAQDYL